MCKQYSDIVVGIDIAGYENGHIYKTDKELLMVAAMEYCKENGINRTVHAGETPAGASSVRNVSFSVLVNISLILLKGITTFSTTTNWPRIPHCQRWTTIWTCQTWKYSHRNVPLFMLQNWRILEFGTA